MKVLVTDGNYNQTLSIVRTLGKKGLFVSVISNKPYALASLSKYCKKLILSPPVIEEESFIKFLYKITPQFDLLIPVGSNSVRVVSKYKERLSKFVNIELPSAQSVFIALNKKETYKLAQKLNIPIPHTYYPTEIEEVEKISHTIIYPVVIKALEDRGIHIVKYIKTQSQLFKEYIRVCEFYKFRSPNLPMIQQYVEGDGYGFFALYEKGKVKRIFMHHRIREYPVTGGASSCAESFWDPRLKEYGKKLLDTLKWHGPCMVEFKGNRGNYKLMEINPKFWGSLDLALACGVDFPYLLCKIARGERIKYSEKYRLKVKLHWPLSDDLFHIFEKPSSIIEFIKDCFSAKSNIRLEDIVPNLYELKETSLTFIRKILRKCVKVL
jgi:predicted ATP-grasp superfamily ATP-dependent carboligase